MASNAAEGLLEILPGRAESPRRGPSIFAVILNWGGKFHNFLAAAVIPTTAVAVWLLNFHQRDCRIGYRDRRLLDFYSIDIKNYIINQWLMTFWRC